MSFGTEIKRLREDAKISVQKIADKIGVDADRWRKWEEKDLTPRIEDANLIETFFGMDIEKIMKLHSIKKFLIVPHEKSTSNLNLEEQETPISTKKNFREELRNKKNNSGPYMVPLVPVAAQAGYAKNCYDLAYIEKLETYPILPGVDPHGASWRYFQVQGDSMLDTLKPDQFILTSQVIKEDWRNVEHRDVYVIITHEGVIVKRLYKVKGKDYWAAVSDNPDENQYPQFRIYVKDVHELWKFRRKVDWDAPAPRKVEIKV